LRPHDHGAGENVERVHVLHELRHVCIARPQHDVLCRARLHNASALQHRDAVAELQSLIEIMAHEEKSFF